MKHKILLELGRFGFYMNIYFRVPKAEDKSLNWRYIENGSAKIQFSKKLISIPISNALLNEAIQNLNIQFLIPEKSGTFSINDFNNGQPMLQINEKYSRYKRKIMI